MKRKILLSIIVATLGLIVVACEPAGAGDGAEAGGSDTTQDETPDYSGDPVYTSATIGTLMNVPAGSFQRDSTASNVSIISESFSMSEHEITQSQFEDVMGVNPSDFSSGADAPDRPVDSVSWYDAIAFANKLSIQEGLTPVYSVSVDGTPIDWEALDYADIPREFSADIIGQWNAATADWSADGYRLPTEMEWMWAAMGADQDGQPGAMQNGVNVSGYDKFFAGYDGSNATDATDYAWYGANTSITQPVGTKKANELGLHDMSGNENELTWDWYDSYPVGEVTDYRGPASGSSRVTRGGRWGLNSGTILVGRRALAIPRNTAYTIRLVRP